MYENNIPQRRYDLTLKFMRKHLKPGAKIIDFGIENPLSKQMIEHGYEVDNTGIGDLDEFEFSKGKQYDCATGFEVLEHLLNPYTLLKKTPTNYLCVSIPMRLWFSSAFRNPEVRRDCHFHEFEDWQFDWLLESTGWEIIDREKWTNPVKKIGFRPLLRLFTPRYYVIFAKRKI